MCARNAEVVVRYICYFFVLFSDSESAAIDNDANGFRDCFRLIDLRGGNQEN